MPRSLFTDDKMLKLRREWRELRTLEAALYFSCRLMRLIESEKTIAAGTLGEKTQRCDQAMALD